MTTLPTQFICFCPESPYCLLFTAVGIRLWRENSCNHTIALFLKKAIQAEQEYPPKK